SSTASRCFGVSAVSTARRTARSSASARASPVPSGAMLPSPWLAVAPFMIVGREHLGLAVAVEEDGERVLGRKDARVRSPPADVPSAEALEIDQLGRPTELSACAPRIAEEIEVVADEPDGARADEAVEEVCPDFVVRRPVV